MFSTCRSTVRTLTTSSAAIASFERPWASSRKTSRSRGVRRERFAKGWENGGAELGEPLAPGRLDMNGVCTATERPQDLGQLETRPRGLVAGAALDEQVDRLLERRPRRLRHGRSVQTAAREQSCCTKRSRADLRCRVLNARFARQYASTACSGCGGSRSSRCPARSNQPFVSAAPRNWRNRTPTRSPAAPKPPRLHAHEQADTPAHGVRAPTALSICQRAATPSPSSASTVSPTASAASNCARASAHAARTSASGQTQATSDRGTHRPKPTATDDRSIHLDPPISASTGVSGRNGAGAIAARWERRVEPNAPSIRRSLDAEAEWRPRPGPPWRRRRRRASSRRSTR